MKKEVIICDGCGKEKLQSNHWYSGASAFVDDRTASVFCVRKGAHLDLTRHFCSQGCVSAALQQWMDTEEK